MSARAILWLMCVTLGAGCEQSHTDEIRDRWSKWRALGLSDYAFTWRPNCYCSIVDLQGTRVEVHGGRASAAIGVSEGRPDVDHARTIDALFQDALASAEREPDELSVDFDPTHHFISRFAADPDRNAVDDEHGFNVRCFSRDPSGCPISWLTSDECRGRGGTPTPQLRGYTCTSPSDSDTLGPISDAQQQVCCLHPREP